MTKRRCAFCKEEVLNSQLSHHIKQQHPEQKFVTLRKLLSTVLAHYRGAGYTYGEEDVKALQRALTKEPSYKKAKFGLIGRVELSKGLTALRVAIRRRVRRKRKLGLHCVALTDRFHADALLQAVTAAGQELMATLPAGAAPSEGKVSEPEDSDAEGDLDPEEADKLEAELEEEEADEEEEEHERPNKRAAPAAAPASALVGSKRKLQQGGVENGSSAAAEQDSSSEEEAVPRKRPRSAAPAAGSASSCSSANRPAAAKSSAVKLQRNSRVLSPPSPSPALSPVVADRLPPPALPLSIARPSSTKRRAELAVAASSVSASSSAPPAASSLFSPVVAAAHAAPPPMLDYRFYEQLVESQVDLAWFERKAREDFRALRRSLKR